jgi:hypothetical protein
LPETAAKMSATYGGLAHSAVTVTTTAAALGTASQISGNGMLLSVPSGGATVYIGSDATVTTSTGTPIDAGQKLELNINNLAKVFAIVASGTQSLRVLRAL